MNPMRLTAIVLTYNEEEHLPGCLATLTFADAILVVDSFSTDSTVAIAREAGAEVMQRVFEDYPSQRNAALEHVHGRTDWILFVDADERVTAELAEEAREKMHFPGFAGFRIPRHNYIFGKLTRGAGWYPDYQLRLLRSGAAHYDPERKVHEVVILDGREGTLTQPLIHYNYRDLGQFLRKQRRYSRYDAQIMFSQGIRPKLHTPFTMPVRHFWYRFIVLKGYTDGLHGLWLSLLMAWNEFVKYRLLNDLWIRADYQAGQEKA